MDFGSWRWPWRCLGALRRKSVPKVRKSSPNEVKIVALGPLWGPLGTHLGHTWYPVDAMGGFGCHFGDTLDSLGRLCGQKCRKSQILWFWCPSAAKSILVRVWGGSVEHFGPPSGPWERPLGSQDSPNLPRRGHLSHQRQQKSASRGRSFVGVMETNGNRVEIRSGRRSKLCKTQDND